MKTRRPAGAVVVTAVVGSVMSAPVTRAAPPPTPAADGTVHPVSSGLPGEGSFDVSANPADYRLVSVEQTIVRAYRVGQVSWRRPRRTPRW